MTAVSIARLFEGQLYVYVGFNLKTGLYFWQLRSQDTDGIIFYSEDEKEFSTHSEAFESGDEFLDSL